MNEPLKVDTGAVKRLPAKYFFMAVEGTGNTVTTDWSQTKISKGDTFTVMYDPKKPALPGIRHGAQAGRLDKTPRKGGAAAFAYAGAACGGDSHEGKVKTLRK